MANTCQRTGLPGGVRALEPEKYHQPRDSPGVPSSEGARGLQTETLLSVKRLYSLKKVQQDGWRIWGVKYPFITMCPQGEENRSSDVFLLQWAIRREQDLEDQRRWNRNSLRMIVD